MAYQAVTRSELRTKTSPRPGTRALHDVIIWLYHSRGARSGGIYNRRPRRGLTVLLPSTASLHAVGRALDVMVPHPDRDPLGWEIALRVIKHADALGVSEVIFARKRWTKEKGTVAYHGSNPHLDHVHIGMTIDMADNTSPQLRQWFAHFLGS